MRRRAKADRNHAELSGLFRALGCVVEDIHDIGRGLGDLLVRLPHGGRVLLVEIKDGERPPSERKLTPAEAKQAARWGDAYVVVTSQADVRALVWPRARVA